MTDKNDKQIGDKPESAAQSGQPGKPGANPEANQNPAGGGEAEANEQTRQAAPDGKPIKDGKEKEASGGKGSGKQAAPPPTKGSDKAAGSGDGRQPSGGTSKAGVTALVLSLLVAAGAGAGGYYLWLEQQKLQQAQSGFVAQDQLQQVEELAQGVQQETAALSARLNAVAEERAELDSSLVRLEEALAQLERNQQTLNQRMDRVDAIAEKSRADWIRGEAAYLAGIAQQRLNFNRDVDGALSALRTADRLLSQLGTGVIAQRQAVSRAVDRLVAVPVPNKAELTQRLDSLLENLEQLSVAHAAQRSAPERENVVSKPAEGWREAAQRAWNRFTSSLSELVVVQREREVAPLLAPDERYYLYQNLRLALETARLALLMNNEVQYRSVLEGAGKWLQRYFDTDDEQVKAAIAEIKRLAEVNVAPPLPELGEILQPVTERE